MVLCFLSWPLGSSQLIRTDPGTHLLPKALRFLQHSLIENDLQAHPSVVASTAYASGTCSMEVLDLGNLPVSAALAAAHARDSWARGVPVAVVAQQVVNNAVMIWSVGMAGIEPEF
eukprot:4261111-Amphidinium_carterae.1